MKLFILIVGQIIGIVIALRRKKTFVLLIGLEITFYCFLPIFLVDSKKKTVWLNKIESRFFYFIFKVFGRYFLWFRYTKNKIWFLGMIGLLLKLGFFRFNFGVVNLCFKISFSIVFLLLVVQKIIPFFILLKNIFSFGGYFFWLIIFLKVFIGGFCILKTKNFIGVLSFRSIIQIGFILLVGEKSFYLGSFYFFVYSITIFVILFIQKYDFMLKRKNFVFLIWFWFFCGKIPFFGLLIKILILFCSLKKFFIIKIPNIFPGFLFLFFYLYSIFIYFYWIIFIKNQYSDNKKTKINKITILIVILFILFFVF